MTTTGRSTNLMPSKICPHYYGWSHKRSKMLQHGQGCSRTVQMFLSHPVLEVLHPRCTGTHQPCVGNSRHRSPRSPHKYSPTAGLSIPIHCSQNSETVQFEMVKAKSDKITEFLWKTPLTKAEAWTYYTACYLPRVTYPLTGSHLTAAQLTTVQEKAVCIIIPRCGFNRHTHRAIIYGPRSLGGACFRHLHVEQGVEQVTYFLRQWRLDATVGRALRCVMAWLQLSVGVSYPVLEYPLRLLLPHMESLWVALMRQFLGSTKTSIQLNNPSIPPGSKGARHVCDGSHHRIKSLHSSRDPSTQLLPPLP